MDEFLAKHLFGGFAVYITRDSKHVATVLGVSHDDAHAIIAGNETAVRLDIAWYVDRLAIAVLSDLIDNHRTTHLSVFRGSACERPGRGFCSR